MTTVEKQWQAFWKGAYSEVPEGSRQFEVMKQVWFCAYLDMLGVAIEIPDKFNEDDGAQFLSNLHKEAIDFVREDIKKDRARNDFKDQLNETKLKEAFL